MSNIPTATQLKTTIQSRWARPERVEGWAESGLNAEFRDAACRQAWMNVLRRAAAESSSGAALDVGTGPGTMALLWAQLGYKTTGVDFSPGMLDVARSEATARRLKLRVLEGDAEDPPVGRQKFDVISSRFVLFTLPHPGYAVRRWVHLLRTGGVLALVGHEHAEQAGPMHARRTQQTPPTDAEQKHREALSHLPFVNHKAKDLQVVMEAVGLQDIQLMPMEEVLEARTALRGRIGADSLPQSTPFVIAGRK